jgi:hypothetical protein
MAPLYYRAMLILFRLIHILGGVFWAGTAMFTAAFLIPSVRALGPGGGPVMQQIAQVRKLPVYFMTAGFLTVLSGLGLYWRAAGGFTNKDWLRSGSAMTFGIGAVLALVAMTIGIALATPTAKRAGILGAQMAAAGRPSPEQLAEMQALQAKLGLYSKLAAALLLLTTAAMAVARYVP